MAHSIEHYVKMYAQEKPAWLLVHQQSDARFKPVSSSYTTTRRPTGVLLFAYGPTPMLLQPIPVSIRTSSDVSGWLSSRACGCYLVMMVNGKLFFLNRAGVQIYSEDLARLYGDGVCSPIGWRLVLAPGQSAENKEEFNVWSFQVPFGFAYSVRAASWCHSCVLETDRFTVLGLTLSPTPTPSPPAYPHLHNRDVIQTHLCSCSGMITGRWFCCLLNMVLFVLSMYTPRWQTLFHSELSGMGY